MEKCFVELVKLFSKVYETDGLQSFVMVVGFTILLILNVLLMYAIYKMDKANRAKDEKFLNLYTDAIVPVVSMMRTIWFLKHGEEYESKKEKKKNDNEEEG
ncbi:MAG: hypothetical protein M0R03_03690 [Novosphingobium sp.]|nr:hypothetical protein [Novosphingobium sp.]